ncbi:polyprenyl synthetase family protein [Sporolactobacillus laevolacticus]|uniref:polyprenyl synthetase family protein n=1 Tax=Sporolactobacillus laevolacticus TaxID=33018 RepID=UPI0025B4E6F1|nr:class 1 isoprenoid biosynthesis enzyme [Sporolactobacillus laevolacticus]MDN3956086.1 class 1 isoprenoid biosynthesis enzyme [Sporolactobacillus laevolacticus]
MTQQDLVREKIRQFIRTYLHQCDFDNETLEHISSLLMLKGKIFNDDAVFTWAEFNYYVSSIFDTGFDRDIARIACSAAIEWLILATDILDDLTDQDLNGDILTKISQSQAVTLSSVLLMESLHLIDQYNRHSLPLVINLLRKAARGQVKDLSFTLRPEHIPNEEDYFNLISLKSVSLTRLVFQLNQQEDCLFWDQIATLIGYSGQIRNDINDIFNDTKNDIIENKATLPLIKAMEASQSKDGNWLLNQMRSVHSIKDQGKLKIIREYVQKSGAIDYCTILSKVYINKAIKMLKGYQHTHEKKTALSNLINFLGDDQH